MHRRGGRPISTNPIIDSIASGSAPRVAKLAAARGMLPLGAEDMIEALRLLTTDVDDEVRSAATSTLKSYDMGRLRPVVENPNAPASVVSFLATWKWLPRDLYQPLIFHENMPDEALETMAATSELAEVIELVALKQQSLIRTPTIIDAILANPRRTPEAERRAREIKQEFFEKEYGAGVVAGEQRAQAGVAEPEPEPEPQVVHFDDLSQFIEPDLVDTVDVLYQEFLDGYGITEKDLPPDDIAERNEFDIASFFAGEEFEDAFEDEEGNEERVSVLARIARMSTKDRIKFALKGTREVRMILIRDPNRPVCAAVLQPQDHRPGGRDHIGPQIGQRGGFAPRRDEPRLDTQLLGHPQPRPKSQDAGRSLAQFSQSYPEQRLASPRFKQEHTRGRPHDGRPPLPQAAARLTDHRTPSCLETIRSVSGFGLRYRLLPPGTFIATVRLDTERHPS